MEAFEGVELDAAARAEIEGALLACAVRRRALDALWDGSEEDKRAAIEGDAATNFLQIGKGAVHHDAFLDPYPMASEDRGDAAYREGEPAWPDLTVATVKRPRRKRTAAAASIAAQ